MNKTKRLKCVTLCNEYMSFTLWTELLKSPVIKYNGFWTDLDVVALSHHVISRNTKNDLLPVGPDTASQPDPRKRSLKTYNKHQSAVEVKLFDPDPNDAPRPASPRLLTPSPPQLSSTHAIQSCSSPPGPANLAHWCQELHTVITGCFLLSRI